MGKRIERNNKFQSKLIVVARSSSSYFNLMCGVLNLKLVSCYVIAFFMESYTTWSGVIRGFETLQFHIRFSNA